MATATPHRRADAERNRRRIVDAARQAFAERGLEVPLEDVAELAGVGVGTLYRHFPSREDLVIGCFAERLAAHATAAEAALAAGDGWTGFRQYVEQTCALQAADRGLTDLLTCTFPAGHALEGERVRAFELFVRVLERAKTEGSLRAETTPEDYLLLLMGNAGVVQGAGSHAPDAWRRYVAIMLDGLRARPEPGPLPPAPSPRQMLRATLRPTRRRPTK